TSDVSLATRSMVLVISPVKRSTRSLPFQRNSAMLFAIAAPESATIAASRTSARDTIDGLDMGCLRIMVGLGNAARAPLSQRGIGGGEEIVGDRGAGGDVADRKADPSGRRDHPAQRRRLVELGEAYAAQALPQEERGGLLQSA